MITFHEFVESKDASEYKGLIDLDGVQKEILSQVTRHGKFHHKYKNGEDCDGWKITAAKDVIGKMEGATKNGFYSLLFNHDKTFVIFHGKTFELPRKNIKESNNFQKVISYAKKQKIPSFYIEELEDTFW